MLEGQPTARKEGDTLKVELYKPHPKQREVHADDKQFKILNWGRRTGKSTFVINQVLIKALKNPGRYYIVAPTYRQAKNIYWMDLLFHYAPKALIRKKNEAELYVTLVNGGTIELKGADNADSLRGTGIKGVIFDEYAFMPNGADTWHQIMRPQLLDSGGWAIFISTPNGMNHFYDFVNEKRQDPEWFYSHATTYDNPHIKPEEIEKIKLDTSEDEFAQEYLADFRKRQGLVYKDFSRDIHVETFEPNPSWRYFLTADIGFVNPTAVLLVGVDRDDNWWACDEIYEAGLNVKDLSTQIKNLIGGRYITRMIADSAAAQTIADLKLYSLYFEPVKKEGSAEGSVKAGIAEVSKKLKVQEGTGKPKLKIHPKCENLIWEFEIYHWQDKTSDRNQKEIPAKERDHALDAIRYLAMTVKDHSMSDIYVPPNALKLKRRHSVGRQ